MVRGRFLVLEGIDGCGKTTQAERLVRRLAREGGPPPLHLREPGSTRLGEELRALVLGARADVPLGAPAEALLFVAARRQMLDELVTPALAAGRTVVCERFHGSTFAYQGSAGGVDEQRLLELFGAWAGEPAPDVTILLEIDPEVAARRASARAPADRIEARGLAFQRRVAEGLRRYAERSHGVVRIDASGSEEQVEERVLTEVRRAR